MKFGITGYLDLDNPGIPELAQKAEALGFESLWTGEHIFVPVEIADPVRHGIPLPEMYKHLPDLFVILAAAAAVTTRINSAPTSASLPSAIRSNWPNRSRRSTGFRRGA